MSFWDVFTGLFDQQSASFTRVFLPSTRVDKKYDGSPIGEGEAYCRLWLEEMRLAKGLGWFTTYYPVVHSAIRFDHGGKTVAVPHLAGPTFLQQLTKKNLDKIIQCNHPLTPLFPFNRDVVELQAGLFSVVSDDKIATFINTLGSFAKLLPVPELSAVLNLAEPVYSGIADLFGIGSGRLELGYQQTFVGAGGGGHHELRPGYFAALLTTGSKIAAEELCVVQGSLRLGERGQGKEFLAHNRPLPDDCGYLLFRWEMRPFQDWESLSHIRELAYRAQEAMSHNNNKQAEEILEAIKIAVFRSPDVAKKDKQAMYLKIQQDLRDWGLQAARGEAPRPSLHAIMQRPLPPVDPDTAADLRKLEELLSPDY